MKIIKSIILVSLFCYMSCNDQGCNQGDVFTREYEPVGVGLNVEEIIAKRNGLVVANVCNMVPLEQIAEALGLEATQLEVTDSSEKGANRKSSSCFFKWDDFDLPNAGILFQSMRNPMPDEIPDYVIRFIESKKPTGERGIDEAPILFQDFPGIGDEGAYSTDAGKYFWRLGDKALLSIAFNTTHSATEQYVIARKLATLMTEGYIAGN